MKRTFHMAATALLGALPFAGVASTCLAEDTFSSEQMVVMAGACANCHGTGGRLVGSVPTIAGRPAAVLETRLLEFKHGPQRDATVMDRIAKGFTDEELVALADHFAATDPVADEAPEEQAQEQDAP